VHTGSRFATFKTPFTDLGRLYLNESPSISPFPADQFGLGLHTSSPELGLGLSNFTDTQRYQVWNLGRDLSVYLHQYLQAFIQPLDWSRLAWLAVTIGPGSYTGTRMGVVTARTLAQQLEIPLFPISTLAAAAWAIASQLGHHPTVAVELPAQQGHIYGAIYEYHPTLECIKPLQADRLYTIAAWQHCLAALSNTALPVVGDGMPFPDAQTITTAAIALAQQAWQQGARPHWSATLPFYGESFKR
jgi:tRNA threonylcarbamoyl adenosine modification protein YeaZ